MTVVRDAALFALLDDAGQDGLTGWIYSRQATYAPAGGLFEGGLFDWERALIAHPDFPRDGHVVLGGAGGGRELRALRDLGYRVTAFEPSEMLWRSLAQTAARAGGEAIQASYADLVRADRSGPLATLFDERVDAFVFGWGSFSHLLSLEAQRRALHAVRQRWPRAVVLISFLRRSDSPSPPSPGERWLRGATRWLLSPFDRAREGSPDPSRQFFPHAGFVRPLSEDEFRAMAAAAGFQVAVYQSHPYGAALLA